MKTLTHMLKIVGRELILFAGLIIVIVVGLFVVTSGSYSVPATVANDSTLPRVEIDGITFHAETFGDSTNPVVVVVHGGPGGDYGYLLNLYQLADEYFVVFYDQRGAGLSPRVAAEEITLQSSIDDLHRIINHYGQGEPVRLVGHSWGAMLSAAYVGEYPDSVSQVVLAEPGALDNEGLARFQEHQAATIGFTYYRHLMLTIFESFHVDSVDDDASMDYIYGKMSANFVNTAATGYRCSDKEIKALSPNLSVPPSRFGTVAYKKLFGPSTDLSPIVLNAPKYSGDVLFLASACNSFTGIEFQREQLPIFPQAELAVIPDAGHEMFSENPAESIETVRAFLNQQIKASE